MALGVFKGKLKGATKGFELLKKKADALKVRLRAMTKEIYAMKMALVKQSSNAYFSVSQAEYAAGSFKHKVFEACTVPEIRVETAVDNVAGVKLPVFRAIDTGMKSEGRENIGLSGGGKAVETCAKKFKELVDALIKLASLQTSFLTLDEALKVTNRRVNALENVTIPFIAHVISYVEKELDEMEREEFTRVKMLKSKKEAQLKALGEVESNSSADPDNMLANFDTARDPDVVF